MPWCNAADRDWNIIPTRKRADFRMVIRCETRYRTCRMGKGQDKSRQMNGASKEAKCASSAEPRAWTREELEQARRWVGKLQRRIAKAQREKKYNKVKALQHLLVTSRAAKMLAVARVTSNKGKPKRPFIGFSADTASVHVPVRVRETIT